MIDPELLLVLTSNELGLGPSDLSETLTGLYIGCLEAAAKRPAKIIFLNSAVFLTTEGSPVLEILRKIEEGGTEIASCITCLTYHDRLEKIEVGAPADMKATVADMTSYPRVMTL